MLGSAVSSSTPTDFQPRLTMGFSDVPLMNCQALVPGPAIGCPYIPVGMHRARDSAIGLSSIPTSAAWMLGFVTPLSVSRSFMCLVLRVSVVRGHWNHERQGANATGSGPRMGHRAARRGRAGAGTYPAVRR